MKKALAASLLASSLILPALMAPASAADSVRGGRTIEAFNGSNLVNVQGYPANRSVTVEVLRNGVLAGTAVGKTNGDGYLEFNHLGGGQVSEGGDCFQNPVSPDVMPGDVIRTQVAGETVRDRAVVRDIFLDTQATTVDSGRITVKGHVRGTADGPISIGADVLEVRLNAGGFDWESGEDPGRGDLRENLRAADFDDGDADPTTFTHVFELVGNDGQNAQESGFDHVLEWSSDGAAVPPAIFVSDGSSGGNLPGCPPLATRAVTGKSVAAINRANIAGGLTFSGIASGAESITVTLSDRNADTVDIKLAATVENALISPHQTWKTSAMTERQIRLLRRMDQGLLTASIGQGPAMKVLKDTVAPTVTPNVAPKPGTYTRTQFVALEGSGANRIHYTLDGSTPSAASALFKTSIKVSRTTTIKAALVDGVGNVGPIGTYRYVIN